MNHGKVTVLAGKILLITVVLLFFAAAMASEQDRKAATQRYIIELLDPPLAEYDGRRLSLDGRRLEATIPAKTGALKLDVLSPRSSTYLGYLDGRHQAFRDEANRLLGRQVKAARSYRLATNGMAMDLTETEADILRDSPLVKSIARNRIERYQTDVGPEWIGSGPVWDGTAGKPAAEGEGIIVGILDGGVNWDHLSFSDNPNDGYNYTNPKGVTLGLCGDAEVNCNDKLIGVWDFTQDDPGTDFVEENTNGKDDDGHGSHVASTAAGNRVNLVIAGQGQTEHSGVAPHAHIISYRVCYVPDPDTDDGGCASDAILEGIEQAIEDGVDVINYSIGSTPFNPWTPGSSARAFLNARNAGIFIASSAGNGGPDPGSLGSPANAPWVVAVANGTHNRVEGSLLQDMSGGNTPPPDPILGVSQTGGIGIRKIVHAKDYGFALCGIGEAELAATCAGNTGASNPFAGQVFNGEIVVCDRGTYGRIEKGKNVLLAGAGGMILANVDESGESIVADAHCLPTVHIGDSDGDVLRAWLDSGSDHQASISGSTVTTLDSFGDLVASSSGRGPTSSPVADIMKPNVIAPGTDIRAAWYTGTATFARTSGTSMSSPHVAGAAALLMSVHPDWGADQVQSAIEMTATDAQVRDILGTPGTPHDGGAGRPQLDLAVNAGLYLPMNTTDFFQAAPGGTIAPRDLNLAGLQEDECAGSCRFTRTVRDQMGGGSWTATPVGFPAGVDVTVSPSNFSLGNGATRDLEIEIKINDGSLIGSWIPGKVRLSADGSSDLYLTAMVFAKGGDLPNVLYFQEDRNGGWNSVPMDNIVAMPNATFTSGGLQPITRIEATLPQDPTDDDPYDGGEGVITHWHSLPEGALWVYAQTPASEAIDLDLFVGRDDDGDGKAEESEELCRSISSIDLERCDIYNEAPGDYWVLVQNWDANNNAGDDMTLLTAGIGPSSDKTLAASGPGITTFSEAFDLRISFDDFGAVHGEEYLGAVGIGSSRNSPNNIGVIPVRINRNGYADPVTFPLMDGRTHSLALAAGSSHDRIFIDVPPGADSLTIGAQTREAANNEGLKLELARLDFNQGISTPPFATAAGAQPKLATANGSGSEGPSITLSGGDLQSGRWYAVLTNENGDAVSVDIRADLVTSGDAVDIQWGLWEPSSRPGLGQGYEYAPGRALVWYTYDEDGQPVWFISGAFDLNGNLWTADLLRVTNDGSKQQFDVVGAVSVTMLARNDAMFSWRLYGESGSDRMRPVTFATCPQIGGEEQSYTGLWFRGVNGLGGASVMVNHLSQIQIHYLFDGVGMPRWLIAQDVNDTSPTNPVLPMLQFEGYCAICDKGTVSYDTVGVLERTFTTELAGSWSLDYDFIAPLAGSANRTDSIVKLTEVLDCD